MSWKYYSKGKKRIQQHLFQYCAIWAAHLNWFYFSIRLLLLKSCFLSIKTFIDKVFLCDKSPNPNFTNELKSHLCLHNIIFFKNQDIGTQWVVNLRLKCFFRGNFVSRLLLSVCNKCGFHLRFGLKLNLVH